MEKGRIVVSSENHALTTRKALHPRRRKLVLAAASCLLLLSLSGCGHGGDSEGSLEAVWGRRGISPGRLQKPRAMAIDEQDHVYIVDMLARVQVFDTAGKPLGPGWRTPKFADGKPTGLSINRDGNLMVADTHYYRILFYSPTGELLEDQTIGGTFGRGPGEFGLVTDAVEDSQGNIYVSEYGDFDRIQKFSPEHEFILQWGGHGSEEGQFRRPQNMAVDKRDRIWVVDACNHRIQVFDNEGKRLMTWGRQGAAPGELYYPYDLVVTDDCLYVSEFGNNRVQKFTHDGQSLGCFGAAGRAKGEMHNPWALVQSSDGRLLVLDTNNHRVQVIRM